MGAEGGTAWTTPPLGIRLIRWQSGNQGLREEIAALAGRSRVRHGGYGRGILRIHLGGGNRRLGARVSLHGRASMPLSEQAEASFMKC